MADKTWYGLDAGNEGELNTAANWVPSGVPASGDNVRFPAGSPSVTDDLDALKTATLSGALGVVVFEPGFTGTVGDSSTYMQFTCTRLEFHGRGQAFIDIEASAIIPRIFATANAIEGQRGLYLKGSAMTGVDVSGGNVGLAYRHGETTSATTVRIIGEDADVDMGPGLTTTTVYQTAGTTLQRCASTTTTVYGGTWKSREVGAITTLNARGGNLFPESSGTVTTMNCDGGVSDFTKSSVPRTVSTLKRNPGSVVRYDPSIVTVTTQSAPDYPVVTSYSKP